MAGRPRTRTAEEQRQRDTQLAKRRRTHCRNGHLLSGENVRLGTKGWRVCVTCASTKYGAGNHHWKGGGTERPDGRGLVYIPGHPRENRAHYVLEYVVVAERALGRYLPPTAVVHHLDGNPRNRQNNNLVICENQAYHVFLHRRLRAWRECGHANWRRCRTCKTLKPPEMIAREKLDRGGRHSTVYCVACVKGSQRADAA